MGNRSGFNPSTWLLVLTFILLYTHIPVLSTLAHMEFQVNSVRLLRPNTTFCIHHNISSYPRELGYDDMRHDHYSHVTQEVLLPKRTTIASGTFLCLVQCPFLYEHSGDPVLR
jgi:hypothetical protein